MRVRLQNGQVRFIYKGHRVKVGDTNVKRDRTTTDLSEHECKCSDYKSLSVIQGIHMQAATWQAADWWHVCSSLSKLKQVNPLSP